MSYYNEVIKTALFIRKQDYIFILERLKAAIGEFYDKDGFIPNRGNDLWKLRDKLLSAAELIGNLTGGNLEDASELIEAMKQYSDDREKTYDVGKFAQSLNGKISSIASLLGSDEESVKFLATMETIYSADLADKEAIKEFAYSLFFAGKEADEVRNTLYDFFNRMNRHRILMN